MGEFWNDYWWAIILAVIVIAGGGISWSRKKD